MMAFARLVLDDEGLAERSGMSCATMRAITSVGPARREADDELYRLCRVALSRGAAGKRAQAATSSGQLLFSWLPVCSSLIASP